MKSKLKALQILEVMLNKNRKVRVFSESDNTVFDGEDWVSIEGAIYELDIMLKLQNKKIERLEGLVGNKDYMLGSFKSCETCVYYQEGKQPDGILWQSCDHDFECANIYEFHYKAKDE